jgi:nucleotide-binding universal stress UspA family protein
VDEVNDETDNKRFRILVCIDGSDESYRGLRYAAKLSRGLDADIVLLYVRAIDQGLRSGGLQISVARENMLQWGLELPGIKYLKKGRDLLIEMGEMAADWPEQSTHTDVDGTSLGDNKIEYTNEQGRKIVLKLKVARDIATGIIDQWELGEYDLYILGASERWRKFSLASFRDPAVAEKIAVHAPCSVLVTRELEGSLGNLICTDGTERANDMVRRAAAMSHTCGFPVSILSVAEDDEGRPNAEKNVAEAKKILSDMGIEPQDTVVRVGNPVDEIVDEGKKYSMIVVSDTSRSGLKRFFMGSIAFKVLEESKHSVMVMR